MSTDASRHSGERQLEDHTEHLWRQVPAAFLDSEGVPSSQTFRPTTKDEGKLSVARSGIVDAAEALRRHHGRGYKSVGVLGVTVAKVTEQNLIAWDDSASASPVQDEHAYIDFRDLSKGDQQRRAVLLLAAAWARGWAYLAVST